MSRVSRAIEACRRDQLYGAEAVIQWTQSLAAIEATNRDATASRGKRPARLESMSRCPTWAASINS